jgi:hypothetical protein
MAHIRKEFAFSHIRGFGSLFGSFYLFFSPLALGDVAVTATAAKILAGVTVNILAYVTDPALFTGTGDDTKLQFASIGFALQHVVQMDG